MPEFDALTRAKKAAEQAAQGMKEQMATVAADARDQASSKMGELKERVAGTVADVKDAAAAHLKDLADDLNERLPALREAGYTLKQVAFELGVTPSVRATFSAAADISPERIEAVLEEHKDAKLTATLLRVLYGAYKVQTSIHIVGLKPFDIDVELGVTPAAIVRFTKP
jgi:hypothetical protein